MLSRDARVILSASAILCYRYSALVRYISYTRDLRNHRRSSPGCNSTWTLRISLVTLPIIQKHCNHLDNRILRKKRFQRRNISTNRFEDNFVVWRDRFLLSVNTFTKMLNLSERCWIIIAKKYILSTKLFDSLLLKYFSLKIDSYSNASGDKRSSNNRSSLIFPNVRVIFHSILRYARHLDNWLRVR